MPAPTSLQLTPLDTTAPPTPQQKRFNTLVRQIENARLALKAWQESIPLYQQAYAAEVEPLHGELSGQRRQWALALDGLADTPGLSREDGALLSRLICRIVGELLAGQREDAALQALFARHNGVDFETEEKRQLQETLEMMQEVTGMEMGDLSDIENEDDLAQRISEKMEQEREAERERQAKSKRGGAGRKKREAQAQQATQSIRDIFRKLASALHPDRETDPARREKKTALMQQANQAYAAGDLLALLQLQLEIEQVNAADIAGAGEEKLRRYNQVLAEQLEQLKQEVARIESGFSFDAGLMPGARITPAKLGELIKEAKRQLREDLLQLKQELRMLNDPASFKRWLRRYRHAV